jgi:hypothetical protein
MSNTHKDHIKTDKHDKHFMEHVEKSTHVIEHELAYLPDAASDEVHNLDTLLKHKVPSTKLKH